MPPTSPPAYRLGRCLGQGAVAAVHEVSGPDGVRYAGKVLHGSRDGDVAAEQRFAQEASLASALCHPNIVHVFGMDQGIDETGAQRKFVRMELVEGPSLDVLIARDAPFPASRAVAYARQLAAGLEHAHRGGVVHRDLKPANVLVAAHEGRDVLKIADFGMARASSLAGVDAVAFAITGTPDYMAPECLDPIAVDARTDLYALGCILYEMLTGAIPFPAATPFGVLQRHRDDPPPAVPESVPAYLRRLVSDLLAKNPLDRPGSAGVVLRRLDQDEAGRALSRVSPKSKTARCTACNEPLLPGVSVCFSCGRRAPRLTDGACAVLVTGPGEVGDKLDSRSREDLRKWLKRNSQLGLIGTRALERAIPRLPFVLAGGMSLETAESIVASLRTIGLEAEVFSGWALAQRSLRKKALKMSGRMGLIALSFVGILGRFLFFPPAIVGGTALILATSAWRGSRPVTRRSGHTSGPLEPALQAALGRVEALVPALSLSRHRLALRALVNQIRSLADVLDDATAAGFIDEAVGLIREIAPVDEALAGRDLSRADDELRTLLHRRDVLAGRLMQFSDDLEDARFRATQAALASHDPDRTAADAAHMIEALEEVERT